MTILEKRTMEVFIHVFPMILEELKRSNDLMSQLIHQKSSPTNKETPDEKTIGEEDNVES